MTLFADNGYDCSKHASSEAQCNSASDQGKQVCEYSKLLRACTSKSGGSCTSAFDKGSCESAGCAWANDKCAEKGGESNLPYHLLACSKIVALSSLLLVRCRGAVCCMHGALRPP